MKNFSELSISEVFNNKSNILITVEEVVGNKYNNYISENVNVQTLNLSLPVIKNNPSNSFWCKVLVLYFFIKNY